MPTLRELLRRADLPGPPPDSADPEVTAVAYDSRTVTPGTLFVAVPGYHVDGHRFAADAVGRGAVAVVAEHSPEPTLPPETPLVLVPDTQRALSPLAAVAAGEPSRHLHVAGITGTDGKTTVTTMLHAAWQGAGWRAGALTTVDFRQGEVIEPNSTRQTTLEAVDIHDRLRRMLEAGCTHVAMETSSHALMLHRVDDVVFRTSVYTRITEEHLDFHGTREAYLAAKRMLLERTRDLTVLDLDDEWAYPRLRAVPVPRRLTYSGQGDPRADLRARSVHFDQRRVRFVAETPWGDGEVALQLAGGFNVSNALAAIAAACGTGAALYGVLAGLAALPRVAGRMERVDLGQAFTVVVDYAHTAQALATVLRELRPGTAGRLWVVFGSAGERDRSKRPIMGRVAAELADRIVITDEDPRGEDRLAILEEIAAGARDASHREGAELWLIADREAAIAHALARAGAGDTVLLAGKGHEASIIQGTTALPWSERAAAERGLRSRERAPG